MSACFKLDEEKILHSRHRLQTKAQTRTDTSEILLDAFNLSQHLVTVQGRVEQLNRN